MQYKVNCLVMERLKNAEECFYGNEKKKSIREWIENMPVSIDSIKDAQERLARFASLIRFYFPETRERDGIIESPLTCISLMKEQLKNELGIAAPGQLFLKQDSHLAVAGSVKARGGIYEVLKHTEDLLVQEMGWDINEDYALLAEKKYRDFLSQYTIQVGSTGNLGMSIGIMSAKLGYKVIVHMSSDAKDWKKNLLRQSGVTVMEYADDYSKAVEEGRKMSQMDKNSYFVDDENSINLFLGYTVAAFRLQEQLKEMNIPVDEEHPLFLYIPCGVGGAPGGITYGVKYVFQENAYCYFVEPTQACCMLLGMASGEHNGISVKDIGLSGKTEADGLAVARPSRLVGKFMEPILDGLFTVEDKYLFRYMKQLYETEGIFIEPSACAGFAGYCNLFQQSITKDYPKVSGIEKKAYQGTHIVWATGGSLVPEEEKKKYLGMALEENGWNI